MIEGLLNWLTTLPPGAVYAVIGVLAAVENIFPPFPADASVAIGAFLAHRGVTTAWGVFLVTLIPNIAGAMGMYFLAARHAPALFRSKFARRFLPENGLAFVRREYDRFGVVGLFLGRLLPGFRAIVPPFAGLIHVGPIRAGIPMLLASALWYGGIVWLASTFGAQVESLLKSLDTLNQGMAIAAVVIALALAFWFWRRSRQQGTP
ncbi:MAG: hypothetical protein V4558_10005 [Gemmatimonadota bacterium]